MKIIIDGQPLLGKRTGIGRYTKKLIDEYLTYNLSVELFFNQMLNTNRYKSFLNEEFKGNITINNSRFPYKLIRKFKKSKAWYKYPIDLKYKVNSNTIYHATNFITVPTRYAKQVITIHDLAFLKFPNVVEEHIYRYLVDWVSYSVEISDEIIADSLSTKNDLIDLFEVPENKVTVVYLAAEDHFQKQTNIEINRIRKKYDIPERYMLFVGTLEPKKNLITLVEAIYHLKKVYSIVEKLVIVGAKGWKYDPLFETVKNYKLENDVIFLGYIEDKDLPSVYSGACVFTFPSIYEGFGIPLLEAMQCEVPIIASSTSSIPEVVGDAGLLVKPLDVEEWVHGIYQILTDVTLRQDLVNRGKRQAEKFSWKKVASETAEVYKKALNP